MGSAWNGLTQPGPRRRVGSAQGSAMNMGCPAGVGWGGLLSPALSLERTPGGNTHHMFCSVGRSGEVLSTPTKICRIYFSRKIFIHPVLLASKLKGDADSVRCRRSTLSW